MHTARRTISWTEMRAKAREAGLLTPHILPDGGHLSHRDTAIVLAGGRALTARAAGGERRGAR